jgi:hypothetical protein
MSCVPCHELQLQFTAEICGAGWLGSHRAANEDFSGLALSALLNFILYYARLCQIYISFEISKIVLYELLSWHCCCSHWKRSKCESLCFWIQISFARFCFSFVIRPLV